MTDTVLDLPIRASNRPSARIRPLKALHHMRKLIANKEDTHQVFKIVQALDGNSYQKTYKKFAATALGKQRIAERRNMAPMFDGRREEFLAMPLGTLGRTYADFMVREGLTGQGLVDESLVLYLDKNGEPYQDMLQWYGERSRDLHDMFHVLSGYGRDSLGEATLLGFSQRQAYGIGRGILFIHYMAGREIIKEVPRHIDIAGVLREGRDNGAAAEKILQQDFLALLDRPIEDVRAMLNIKKPVKYFAALEQIREAGIDPLAVNAPQMTDNLAAA